jgi:hypothetical protein
VFVDDCRKGLTEIQSLEARWIFVLAKANHLNHTRRAEYVTLVRGRRSSGHHGVGVLLESCLADHLAFVERTKGLIRHVIEAKLAARATRWSAQLANDGKDSARGPVSQKSREVGGLHHDISQNCLR